MKILALLCLAQGQAGPDVPREHVENVSSSGHSYRLVLAGAMDGTNTLSPIGYGAPRQGFEPMRSVTLENVGERDVVDPWILVNGRRRWRTARDIVAEALASYGDPATMTEGEKARAVWEYQRHHRFHATTWDAEVQDPVKMFNVYGYTLCGDEAAVLMDLWRLAGLKVRRGFPTGHVVSEAWYDGAWHLLDSDEHVICLLRDNATIAGEEDMVRDHDLIKRTHTYGILSPDSRKTDEFSASLYVHDGPRQGEHRSHVAHTMGLTLRPGEALEWRWDHRGKQHTAGQALREGWGNDAWARLRNGRWTYAPPLRRASARAGILSEENVRWSESALAPERPAQPARVVWKMAAPYVLVGGAVRVEGKAEPGGSIGLSLSFDGKAWSPVPDDGSLDSLLPALGPARYACFIRLELNSAVVDSIRIEFDLQMSAMALPSLERGENTIAYSDATREPHAVRITHRWVEREGPPPPPPPAAPVSPVDGGEVEGTKVVFRWKPPETAGGPKAVDYHFQLGERPDLRWVLSPNFDKVIWYTADRGKAQYSLPDVGLLNPDQKYFWRVRAKDDRGVWGAWSPAWSFVARGPGVPLKLRWEGKDLAWDPNPRGRAPVRYEVHSSDERGFTATEQETPVFAGNQKTGGLFPGREFVPFPATRIAAVTEPRHPLRPSHAFFRVVAIDEKGLMSGASDVLAARRPAIYTDPPREAIVGTPYRYEAKTVASIGDLRCRTIGGESYNAAFWDAEQPKFSMTAGPAWLSIDPATGVLSGTPGAADAGDPEVRIAVEIAGVGSDTQAFTLRCR